jgi:hypothetical protein
MKGLVLCIVSTLATLSFGSPEPAVGHLRAVPAAAATASAPAAANTAALDLSPLRSDKISAAITIKAFTGITLGAPTFDYHNKDGKGGSGCGSGLAKCSCDEVDNVIWMHGVGTTGTMTGLLFACGLKVDGRDCKLYLEMPTGIIRRARSRGFAPATT